MTDANALYATQPERFAKQPPTMGASDRSNDHDQEQAAPAESVRRAGHAAPCAVGPVAREKGYKAATLRTAPQGMPPAGNGQLRLQHLCARVLYAILHT